MQFTCAISWGMQADMAREEDHIWILTKRFEEVEVRDTNFENYYSFIIDFGCL